MGSLNKVMLIGRLTREPEVTEFKNGSKVADIGFAVHNRRRNVRTGAWEEIPVWLNLKVRNQEDGRKLADMAGLLHKGRLVFVEGHLVVQQWTGKEDHTHHSKLLVYVEDIELMGEEPPVGVGVAFGGGAGKKL
jgi:single-strand DNA-binding protein